MLNGQRMLISLSEPISILKDSFRERTIEILIKQKNTPASLNDKLNYDCTPYMSSLLNEIFDNDTNMGSDRILPSTKILVKDGMALEEARLLSLKVFTLTLDTIASIVPDLSFNDKSVYQVDMCDERDVMISRSPYEKDIDE